MNRRIIAGLMVAATLAAGVVVQLNVTEGNVSKASTPTVSSQLSTETQAMVDQKLASYEEIQEEEKYIADLVSKALGRTVTTSEWEVCLDYLEDNLDSLVKDANVDKDKVTNYVEAYQIIRNDNKAAANADVSMEATGVYNPNYDVNKVSQYIEQYWDYDSYNEDYPDFNAWGGDCANFVSQCLHAGGMQMKGTDATNFNNWFCRTSVTEEFSKTSSTWRGAAAFASYWKKNAIEYYDFGPEYFTDRHAFKDVFEYGNVGDAISFITDNGRPYHTVIIAHKNRDNDRELRFAAHTSSNYEKSLYSYVYGGYIEAVRIYKMSRPDAALEASYNYDTYDQDVDSMSFEDDNWLYDWYDYEDIDTTEDDDYQDGWYDSDGNLLTDEEMEDMQIDEPAVDGYMSDDVFEDDANVEENEEPSESNQQDDIEDEPWYSFLRWF